MLFSSRPDWRATDTTEHSFQTLARQHRPTLRPELSHTHTEPNPHPNKPLPHPSPPTSPCRPSSQLQQTNKQFQYACLVNTPYVLVDTRTAKQMGSISSLHPPDIYLNLKVAFGTKYKYCVATLLSDYLGRCALVQFTCYTHKHAQLVHRT